MAAELVALEVIDDPTEEDRMNAFPVPAERPMVWREQGQAKSHIICGGCSKVVARHMTVLDLFTIFSAPPLMRLVWRCPCGAHLLVPAKRGEWSDWPTVEELKRGGRAGKRSTGTAL